MKLIWCKYNDKYRLIIELGLYGHNIICLDADSMNDDEINIIRNNNELLDVMSLQERIEFVKNNNLFRHYRTYNAGKTVRVNSYNINR